MLLPVPFKGLSSPFPSPFACERVPLQVSFPHWGIKSLQDYELPLPLKPDKAVLGDICTGGLRRPCMFFGGWLSL